METSGEASRQRRAHARLPFSFFLFPSAFSVLLAGCSMTGRPSAGGTDPLVGGPPPAGIGKPTAAPAAATPLSALPPPPVTGSATSTAALAATTPQSFDSSRDLRIGVPPSEPGVTPAAAPADGSAVLRAPEAASETALRRDAAPIYSPVAQGGAAVTSYEQAQTQLAARGILWQRLEMTRETGEWKFSCSVPNRQNPTLRRTYEGRARDYLGAMRAVLDQIDRE
jgi:hypothetical protein